MLAYLSSHLMFCVFMLGFFYGIMSHEEHKQRKQDELNKANEVAY